VEIFTVKKFIFILPLAVLASLGIAINSAYYYQSYDTANYGYLFSIGLSATFMGLEAVLWLMSVNKWYISVLKVAIVFYSVTITLGSQFYSTSELESDIAKTVYVELDTSGDVEYYRKKIDELDLRINEYIAQQKIFGTERSREERESAEKQKDEYLQKLEGSQNKKQEDVKKINNPISIYSFYAYRIPEILNGDIGEDFIRVCFQLFSSVLLAIIAPISLSMIKNYKPVKIVHKPFVKKKQPKKDNTPILKPEISPKLPKVETKTEMPPVKQPKTVPIKPPEPEIIPDHGMSKIDRKNILKMLLWDFDDKRRIAPPEEAEQRFLVVHNDRPEIKAYKKEECKKIYDLLLNKRTAGKNKKEIIEEMIG
jgi:hypothetical protein